VFRCSRQSKFLNMLPTFYCTNMYKQDELVRERKPNSQPGLRCRSCTGRGYSKIATSVQKLYRTG
jgi:hypothetical protein